MPRYVDSVDKIVKTYFACLCEEPFTYKGEEYAPRPLRVGTGLFRHATCPANCGGCCSKFSLDYIPGERLPNGVERRDVAFNGNKVIVFTDTQTDNAGYYCRHLRKEDGRCAIHGKHPLSCEVELFRFSQFLLPEKPNQLTTRLYGRGWRFPRVDGGTGALCEVLPATQESYMYAVSKLLRLRAWMVAFGLNPYRIELILKWSEHGVPTYPLHIT